MDVRARGFLARQDGEGGQGLRGDGMIGNDFGPGEWRGFGDERVRELRERRGRPLRENFHLPRSVYHPAGEPEALRQPVHERAKPHALDAAAEQEEFRLDVMRRIHG